MIRPDQLTFATERKGHRWIAKCNQLPGLRAVGATRIDALDDIMRQSFYRLREVDRVGYLPPQPRSYEGTTEL